MKKMKAKIFATLGVTFMAVAGITGCSSSISGRLPIHEAEVSSVLKDAAYAIDQTYASLNGKTVSADFELVGVYEDIDNRVFNISWSVEVATAGFENAVVVKNGKNKKGEANEKLVQIDVDEESSKDVEFTLKGVMSHSDESVALTPLKMTLAGLKILGWDEYVAVCKTSGSSKGDEKNQSIAVEGYVTTLIGTTNGNSSQALYAQSADGKGAFYAYGLGEDPIPTIHRGDYVRISGESGLYSGSYEILGPSVKVLSTEPHTIAPTDYTSIFTNASTLKDEELAGAQGLYVSISDVEITGEDESNGYYKFKKGSLESYVRISSSVCPISKDAQTKMKADHKAKIGYVADVKGIINVYDGAFYLTPIDAEPFTYKSLPVRSDAEAVAFEKENLSFASVIEVDQTIELPTAGTGYNDVAISWALGGTYSTTSIENNVVTFVQGEADEDVKLVATISRGTVSDTKEFSVTVNSLAADAFMINGIKEAKTGTYKFGLEQVNLGEYLFADGTVNSSEYLATTTNPNKAADFVIDGNATDGYTIKVGDKFVEIYENSGQKVRVRLADTATNKWAWNDTVKLFTTTLTNCQKSNNNAEYYLGTYNTFNTFSASSITYISGNNAKNVGVSQFPGLYGPLMTAMYHINGLDAAKEGSYKFGVEQANLGQYLFADGTVNSSEYLGTTTNPAKAATFTVAGNATDGYTIKVGDKFVEIYENSGQKVRVRLADTATNKWAWNDTLKLFTTTLTNCQKSSNNVEYYLGTYNSFNTFSASNVTYISGNNASKVGVSQFPAVLGSITYKEADINAIDHTAGTYNFILKQANLGQILFADGTVNSSEYLATTTNASKAGKFVVDGNDTDGWTIKVGDKFVEIYENSGQKVRVRLADTATNKWAWNDTVKLFTTTLTNCQKSSNNDEYYLGTYNTYNTFSASSITYISGDNASKVGVSQFPAYYGFITCKAAETPVDPEPPVPPVTPTDEVVFGTEGGTKTYDGSVNGKKAVKCGTSSVAGAMKMTLPSGSKTLKVYVAAWKGDNVVVTITGLSAEKTLTVTANDAISGSSNDFTLANEEDFVFTVDLGGALSADTEITLTATSGKRFVVWNPSVTK